MGEVSAHPSSVEAWHRRKAAGNIARATGFQGSVAVVEAKSKLAVGLCKVLRTLEQQLQEYRQQIEETL